MNIPRISTDGIVLPAKARPAPAKTASGQAVGDVFKPEQNEKLINLIHAEPDARPEAVERARALVAEASYPDGEVLAEVARNFLAENLRS